MQILGQTLDIIFDLTKVNQSFISSPIAVQQTGADAEETSKLHPDSGHGDPASQDHREVTTPVNIT